MSKSKIQIARSMMSNDEIKRHVSPFLCKNWLARVTSRSLKEDEKRARAEQRRQLAKKQKEKTKKDRKKEEAWIAKERAKREKRLKHEAKMSV